MGKHTPEPWQIDIDGQIAYVLDADGNRSGLSTVCALPGEKPVSPETAAERDRLKEINEELLKALMQAAEVLSHCKAAPGYSSMQTRAAVSINSAIAKATGGNQ